LDFSPFAADDFREDFRFLCVGATAALNQAVLAVAPLVAFSFCNQTMPRTQTG